MPSLNRREFLTATLAGLASAGALAACTSSSSNSSGARASGAKVSGSSTSTTGPGGSASVATNGARRPTASALDTRRLVVVEMSGGNDGLSSLVPYGMTGYHDVRKRIAIDPKDLVTLNDKVGLAKTLEPLHKRGVAILQGVGTPNPDGSHFAMMDRWWKGDVRGEGRLGTGFLGRLADAIGDPAARAVALSIGSGNHPALQSDKAVTLSIPQADIAYALAGAKPDDVTRYAFQQALADMSVPLATDSTRLALARRVNGDAVRFANTLHELAEDKGEGYPGGPLSDGLQLTARLFHADPTIRISHVPMNGDFDTHDDNPGRHPGLMDNLAKSLDAFLADLERRGLSDQVLVVTTSEFGRRVRDNGSNGLDHGTASCAFLLGPVQAGLHGEHPSLTTLDQDEQLIATVGFDQYYATLAESWFGVPASDVLAGNPKPISNILRV